MFRGQRESQEPACGALPGEGGQTGPVTEQHRAHHGQEEFCPNFILGQSEKKGFEILLHNKRCPGLGTLRLLLMLLLGCMILS